MYAKRVRLETVFGCTVPILNVRFLTRKRSPLLFDGEKFAHLNLGYYRNMKRRKGISVMVIAEDAPSMSSGEGAGVMDSLRTRFKRDAAVWALVAPVIAHAVRTFGSEEKAHSWLTSRCGALNHQIPFELLKAGRYNAVDEELGRIDYGIYV